MGSGTPFGFDGNNSQESGQVFATNEPAAGDIPVANADGSVTWESVSAVVVPAALTQAQALALVGKAFSAKGDTIIGTAAGTAAILPLGTSTDQLTVGGAGATGVEWATA